MISLWYTLHWYDSVSEMPWKVSLQADLRRALVLDPTSTAQDWEHCETLAICRHNLLMFTATLKSRRSSKPPATKISQNEVRTCWRIERFERQAQVVTDAEKVRCRRDRIIDRIILIPKSDFQVFETAWLDYGYLNISKPYMCSFLMGCVQKQW